MEDNDSKKNPTSSGNNENESENQQNSQMGTKSQQQLSPKNFMAPTISATSKALNPKKKMLEEWKETSPDAHHQKPSNLGPKSGSNKVGISSSNSRKSLPKIPSLYSPDKVLESRNCDDVEEDDFVPDNCIKPYDPITNYLSPRPKYLRYNPNRRRAIVLGSSLSPSVSVDSQSTYVYSSAESSLVPENEGNGHNVEEVVVEKEEEDEVIEERKWGLKWEMFKCLIVFVVLVLSTMYISSMNSHSPLMIPARRGLLEYQNFGNRTFGAVSWSSVVEFGNWEFVEREESERGLFELEDIVVGHEGKSREGVMMGYNETQEIEIAEKMKPLKGYHQLLAWFDVEDELKLISESSKDEQVENEMITISEVINQEIEEEIVVLDLNCKDELVEDEVKRVAYDHNEVNEEENVADVAEEMAENVHDCEKGIVDSESKFMDGESETEAQTIAEDGSDGMEEGKLVDNEKEMMESESTFKGSQEKNVHDYEKGMVHSEPNFEDVQSENEAEMVAENGTDGIVEGYLSEYEKEVIESESKSNDSMLRDVQPQIVVEELNRKVVEGNVLDYEHKQFWVTSNNVVCLVSSLMAFITSLLVRFYFKCKSASSRTSSPRMKLCSTPEILEKRRLRLPPKVGQKIELFQKADSQLNPPPPVILADVRPEKTPPRIIPTVKLLCEIDFEGDFRSSLKSCAMQSNMQESHDSSHSVPLERKAPRSKASATLAPCHSQPSTSELSAVDSLSYGTYKSQQRTTKKEEGKQEVAMATPTPLRRSSRLRNRRATSP